MTINFLEKTNQETITSKPSRALFWIFTWGYGFASLFYIANFYSYGISYSYPSILFAIILLSPIFGGAFIYLDAALLNMTGRLLGSKTDVASLRVALVNAKAPSLLLTLTWAMFLALEPTSVFIQNASNGSAVAMIFCSLGGNIWSFCLLIKHLKKLQDIRMPLALLNASATYIISFFIYATTLFIGRYIYISTF